jgi:hypothetical protein
VSILRKTGAMQYLPLIGTPLPLHENDINLYYEVIGVKGLGGANVPPIFFIPLRLLNVLKCNKKYWGESG